MSLYHEQKFISPQSVYSEVKEELRSYFAAGVIDDVMFPKWTEHVLRRFRKSAFKIEEVVLHIHDYTAELPCDFHGVREAWMCTTIHSRPIDDPTFVYSQKDCRIDIPVLDKCDECFAANGTCSTDFLVFSKTIGTHMYSYRRTFLLRPGNINAQRHCGDHCPNMNSNASDTFDIQGNKFITNFHEGKVHLVYYSESKDEDDNQLIPDSIRFEDYLKKYIIYMCFRQICNQVTDETYNQVEKKKENAKQEQIEAFIIAETDMKKQTPSEKIRQIGVLNRINDVYRLPGDQSYRGGSDDNFMDIGHQFA